MGVRYDVPVKVIGVNVAEEPATVQLEVDGNALVTVAVDAKTLSKLFGNYDAVLQLKCVRKVH